MYTKGEDDIWILVYVDDCWECNVFIYLFFLFGTVDILKSWINGANFRVWDINFLYTPFLSLYDF